MTKSSTLETVREYYGKILQSTKDLKTSACCTAERLPLHHREIVTQIHQEILDRFFGCGSPIPSELEGCTVLDLGCGSGRDVYLLSKLVGPHGRVIGVDMTDEQLAVARKHLDYHTKKFGYSKPNVEFHAGYIEDLESLGIPSNSVDVVVSNCVVNLSPDKRRVFEQAFRALKPGGELYFSDVFASRRVPEDLATDPVLIGECLGGALYIEDFRRMMREVGCLDYRKMTSSPIALLNPGIERKAGKIQFRSVTIRAFKLELEDVCEDYGQVAYYLGTIPESPNFFDLDDHHRFEKGRSFPVCGNSAKMLTDTRFAKHFRVEGDLSTHYGPFNCGPSPVPNASVTSSPATCC